MPGKDLDRDAPAQKLLHPGDIILAVNGKWIQKTPTSSALQAHRGISNLIEEVQHTKEGQSIIFTVRNPKTRETRNVHVTPQRKENSGIMTCGVYLLPNFIGLDTRNTKDPFEATALASSYVVQSAKDVAIGLATFSSDFVSGRMDSSEYRLSGPVSAVKKTTEIVKTKDWDTVLDYTAAASINLGMFNCLPVPPSDGFQIVMATFAAVLLSLKV